MAYMKEAANSGGLTALALQKNTVAVRDEMALYVADARMVSIATLAHPLESAAYRAGENSTTIGELRSSRCNR
jgi:hypothetical protein